MLSMDSMIVKKNNAPRVAVQHRSQLARKVHDNIAATEKKESHAATANSRLVSRSDFDGFGYKKWIMLGVLPIVTCLLVGFLYRRATLLYVPEYITYDTVVSLRLSNEPRPGMVHGIWINLGSGDSTADLVRDMNMFLPDYIPLAQMSQKKLGLLVSDRDIEKVLDMHSVKKMQNSVRSNISVVSVEMDPYVWESRPVDYVVHAKLRIEESSVVDVEELKKQCQHKSFRSTELKTCLFGQGITSARVINHPWFVNRLPPARAMDIRQIKY
jgi:hypothetical protein